MNDRRRYWIGIIAMLFLGMIFLVAGVGKLALNSTSMNMPVPAYLTFLPGNIGLMLWRSLPYIEVAIGTLLILGIGIKFSALLAGVLVAIFISSNLILIQTGEYCYTCFGVYGRLTAESAFIFDLFMAGLIAIVLLCYRGAFFNVMPLVLTSEHDAAGASAA